MALPRLLQDAQGIVGPLPFAVELDPSSQPIILYLAGREAGRGRGGRGPDIRAGEAQRGGDREGGDEQEREKDQEGPRLNEKDNTPAKKGEGTEKQGEGSEDGQREARRGEPRRGGGRGPEKAGGGWGWERARGQRGQGPQGGHSECPSLRQTALPPSPPRSPLTMRR